MGFRYNPGQLLGTENILFLRRTIKTKSGKWKGIFKCPYCGNEFEAILSKIISGHTKSCGCLHRKVVSKDLTGKRFGKLVTLQPTDRNTSYGSVIWKCRCDCGNICYVPAMSLKEDVTKGTKSCGCLKSLGEQKIISILENNNIEFQKEKEFKQCINPKTGKSLRFDFYLPDYNTCIEYDGKQHFKTTGGWESLEFTQERDNIKNKFCKKFNILLIRIPYWDLNILDDNYLLSKIS